MEKDQTMIIISWNGTNILLLLQLFIIMGNLIPFEFIGKIVDILYSIRRR